MANIIPREPTDEMRQKMAAQDRMLGAFEGFTERQIRQESAFDPNAKSGKGALGYAQVIPETLANVERDLGRKLDPKNFDDALAIHGFVMKQNLRKFGNLEDATRAYNGGWNPDTWGNDETTNYINVIFGGKASPSKAKRAPDEVVMPTSSVMTDAAAAAKTGLSKVEEQLDRTQRFSEQTRRDSISANAAPLIGNVTLSPDYSNTEAATKQGIAQVSAGTHEATMAEAFTQAFDTNLTGTLIETFKYRNTRTPWAATEEQLADLRTQPAYADDDMRNYVLGATSNEDFAQRLENANERIDVAQRVANTDGLKGWGVTAASFAGGMADPAAIALTMATGGAFGAARATAVAARGAVASRMTAAAAGAVGGAVENVAIDALIRDNNNQEVTAAGVMQQATFGAAFGALGAMAFHRNPGELPSAPERAAEATVLKRSERAANEPSPHGDPVVGSAVGDLPAENPVAALVEQPTLTSVATKLVDDGTDKVGRDAPAANEGKRLLDQPTLVSIRNEEALVAGDMAKAGDLRRKAANDSEARGWTPEVIEGGKKDATPAPEPVFKDSESAPHATVDLTGKQIITGMDNFPSGGLRAQLDRIVAGTDDLAKSLANRILAGLRGFDVAFEREADDAAVIGNRGVYRVSNHTISVARDADDFVILHEGAHALTAAKVKYGQAKPDTAHGRIVGELESIRLLARETYLKANLDRMDEGAKMAKYYLSDVNEFIAGLFSGKSEFIEHLAAMTVDGKNIGKTLVGKLFDAVRRLLGVEVHESSALARALNLTDELMDTKLNWTVLRPDGENFSALQMPVLTGKDLAQNEKSARWSQAIEDHIEVKGEASKRLEAWYSSGIRNASLDKTGVGKILDSVGNTLARSKSKGVRMVASLLAEDPSGLNRQHAASAALDMERLKHSFREPFIDAWYALVPKLLDGAELVKFKMGGAGDAQKRISRQVAEYRLAKRNARLAEVEFDASGYNPVIRQLGNHLDGFWRNIHEASKVAGEEHGNALGGKGWQGHMPYRWDWAAIHKTAVENPEKFQSLRTLFRNEYIGKVVDPAVADALKKGATPDEILDLREQLNQKVTHLVDNYINQVRRDPDSRIQHEDNFIAKVSEDLLLDEFRGKKITNEVVDEFKRRVEEIKNDRTRTEFDLLKTQNGVSMLDFIDSDIGRMVDTNSQRFAGNISLARRGLGDEASIDGMKDALFRDGATPEDLKNIDFLIRSLNGKLNPDEAGAAKILSQGAYMSMMGKLGFNAIADAAGTITSVGVTGMFRVLGRGFVKDDALLESLRKFAPGAIAHDPRLFAQTVDGQGNPAAMWSEGSALSNVAQGGATAVSHLSGLHYVSKFLHRGFIPVFADDLIQTIQRGEGMSAARLGDLGLTSERIDAIRNELSKHDAGREPGAAVNWSKWDPKVADDMIAAIQRGTGQALQRSFVGETPRWVAETTVGRLVAQFRRFGFLAAEKQTVRNIAIGDSNSAAAFTVGTAMGAALYYAKLQANTVGMSEGQREKYLEDNFSGMKGVTGILIMTNMTGMAADGVEVGSMLLNGRQHGNSGSAVASLGYLQNLAAGGGALGSAAMGTLFGDEVDYQKKAREGMRWLPGANTIFGTALSNSLHSE